ncbi:hypothetical protein KUH03_14270 [Sphingobacterium sp. E70]|uniref:hypothetical protein n=1 Tax=Sphingobacterium sp. E70 TaxID=2853439 RepID=UPI00211CA56C|nr:hypothetical protein [Sphingobacterium sp. E70]ULT27728.1 hypothetical protein KUH03_14270 [Sphingobacterium sp. E70]
MSAEIGKRKEKKKKKLQKFLEVQKISTFAVPTETEGNKKDKEGRNAHRNIADTEVEAR